jgi:hypothetical protein
MKNLTFLILVVFTITVAIGQKASEKLEKYTASNGITYEIGDQIQLGKGSGTNGEFVYINRGGSVNGNNSQNKGVGSANAGLLFTIKKMNKYNFRRIQGVYLTLKKGKKAIYTLDLENAIVNCEVGKCDKEDTDDQVINYKNNPLGLLKKRYKDGSLSKKQYEAEKRKMLEQ